jgi:hypothetical protein
MPLLAYFSIIGAFLMALLLVANVVLEPRPHTPSKAASTAVETKLPKPRITSRVGQQTVGDARISPWREARHETPPPAAPVVAVQTERTDLTAWNSAHPARERQPGAGGERKSFKRAKPKGNSVLVRTRVQNPAVAWRQHGKTRTYSARAYAGPGHDRSGWSFSAEGTLGPH